MELFKKINYGLLIVKKAKLKRLSNRVKKSCYWKILNYRNDDRDGKQPEKVTPKPSSRNSWPKRMFEVVPNLEWALVVLTSWQ